MKVRAWERVVVGACLLAAFAGDVAAHPRTGCLAGEPAELAFVSDRDGDPEIFRSREDGSALRQLTDNPAIDSAPAWSPDGQWVAFESNRGGDLDVYVMAADGRSVRNVTQSPASLDAQPAWSPDGRTLAFHSDRDGDLEIYAVELATGRQWNVSNNHPGPNSLLHPTRAAADVKPSWGQTGRISFESYRDPTTPFPDIWSIAADGTDARAVTTTPDSAEWFPAWSPDGRSLAFMSTAEHSWDIWVSATDGSGGRPLLSTWKSEFLPAWSPDGKRIAFSSTMADGGRDLQVGSVGMVLVGDPGEEVDHDLYIANLDGGCLTRVFGGPHTDADPAYRPPRTG